MARFAGSLVVALFISLALFWIMQFLIRPQGREQTVHPSDSVAVHVVHTKELSKPDSESFSGENGGGGRSAPPGPPPVPGIDTLGSVPVPAPKADADIIMPDLDFKPDLSSVAGMGEDFGGFVGGGSGGGFGGGTGTGYGDGAGAGRGGRQQGDALIPLSTARPQIPQRACDRGVEGYAVAEYTVNPNGRVTNIRILDAEPRGIFEKPMIKSLEHWMYAATDGKTYDVIWKFDFKLSDCKLNWRLRS